MMMPPFHNPEDCGWPRLYLKAPNGIKLVINATAGLVNGSAILLSAAVPLGWQVEASSYGRASWPMTVFFSETGVPVLPWFAALNQTLPWEIPMLADGEVDPGPVAELERPWEDVLV